MTLSEELQAACQQGDINRILASVPYAQLIGMESLKLGEELIFKLPVKDSNIGNPTLPAIHGGVIGGFMESAAIVHVLALIGGESIPKVVDFSLDYLRAGRQLDTYARCQVVRHGRKAVNVSVSAWQTRPEEPISNARTHLLL